jgi:hypothetical protein
MNLGPRRARRPPFESGDLLAVYSVIDGTRGQNPQGMVVCATIRHRPIDRRAEHANHATCETHCRPPGSQG